MELEKVTPTSDENMFNILISDTMSMDGLQSLYSSSKVHVIQENIEGTTFPLEKIDALLIRSATKVSKELLKKMPQLKIIGRADVAVDNIDLETATAQGVVVINAPEGNTISTTEHTFAMMLALLRNIPQAYHSMKEERWDRELYEGTELYGKTLGIIGYGRIGSELASRARAFEMNVLVYDPFLTSIRAEKNRIKSVSLEELLANSDIITVHTPLTKETKGLLNEESLAKTKKGVYLINCARGGIIDEEALYDAVSDGHVQGAAIDVFVEEPAINHPLTSLPQLITTPHIGASTSEAQLNVAKSVAKEVLDFLIGKPAPHALNLPYLDEGAFSKFSPARKLTRLLGEASSQLFRQPAKEIEITYAGEISHQETGLFNRSLLTGFFRHRIDEYVNDVNASYIAKQRELNLIEKHGNESKGFANFITVVVRGLEDELHIHGTFSSEFGPRIVQINEYVLDFQPASHHLYIQHHDQPGVIGKVGQLLGENDVNIASMQVGRNQEGGKAVMLLSTDRKCEDKILEDFQKLDEIFSVSSIEL